MSKYLPPTHIEEAKEKFLLQNPHISFGYQINENSNVFPFRFSFIKGKTYLLLDATDETPVVEEAKFTSFTIDEIRDENTGFYKGYEVFYNFQTKTRPDLCISETVVLHLLTFQMPTLWVGIFECY